MYTKMFESLSLSLSLSLPLSLSLSLSVYIYIYIYLCVCVCNSICNPVLVSINYMYHIKPWIGIFLLV